MTVLMPETPQEMLAGDKGKTISWLITKGNRKEVRNLTGYSAWTSFWYRDAAPHIVRVATSIDAANGLVYYTLQGDELPTVGDVFAQCTVRLADWYIGTATGRAGLCASGETVAIKVLRRPS